MRRLRAARYSNPGLQHCRQLRRRACYVQRWPVPAAAAAAVTSVVGGIVLGGGRWARLWLLFSSAIPEIAERIQLPQGLLGQAAPDSLQAARPGLQRQRRPGTGGLRGRHRGWRLRVLALWGEPSGHTARSLFGGVEARGVRCLLLAVVFLWGASCPPLRLKGPCPCYPPSAGYVHQSEGLRNSASKSRQIGHGHARPVPKSRSTVAAPAATTVPVTVPREQHTLQCRTQPLPATAGSTRKPLTSPATRRVRARAVHYAGQHWSLLRSRALDPARMSRAKPRGGEGPHPVVDVRTCPPASFCQSRPASTHKTTRRLAQACSAMQRHSPAMQLIVASATGDAAGVRRLLAWGVSANARAEVRSHTDRLNMPRPREGAGRSAEHYGASVASSQPNVPSPGTLRRACAAP